MVEKTKEKEHDVQDFFTTSGIQNGRLKLLQKIMLKNPPPRNLHANILLKSDGDSQWIKVNNHCSIGNHKDNSIQLDNKYVSKEHCLIHKFDDKWCIQDLNSKNGTYLNGGIISEKHKLYDGDLIKIGNSSSISFAISLTRLPDKYFSQTS